MEWVRCECGCEAFKITTKGKAYCSECMKPLEKKIRIPKRKPSPDIPDHDWPDHPDLPGPLKF